jgi:hypothetical protein
VTESGQGCFARIRELENEFHEKFSETILGQYERLSKGDIDEVDDDIRDLLGDKDSLVNSINSSHDFRLMKFDHQVLILCCFLKTMMTHTSIGRLIGLRDCKRLGNNDSKSQRRRAQTESRPCHRDHCLSRQDPDRD